MLKSRLLDIDRAKGFAIILVVLGHLVAREMPKGNDWYAFLKVTIYTFHMAFFMCLSGIVMQYSYKSINSMTEYRQYVWKKFLRLIPAYIIFSIVIFLGKLISSRFLFVDNPVQSIYDFSKIFVCPKRSFSVYLWYAYVLFIFYALIPILLKATRNNINVLLLISFPLIFLKPTDYLALNYICTYLFFFVLGARIAVSYEGACRIIDRFFYLFLGIFIAIVLFEIFYSKINFVAGVFSVPVFLGLVRRMSFKKSNSLDFISKYVFAIYLMNTVVIGFIKAILFKVLPWNGVNFLLYFPLLLVGGLLLPIIIKKYIFRFVPWLDRCTT